MGIKLILITLGIGLLALIYPFLNSNVEQLTKIENQKLSLKLLIAVDEAVKNHHGKNLQNYVNTIVATGAKVMKEPTLGHEIEVKLVSLVVLGQKEFDDLNVVTFGGDKLHLFNFNNKFCNWVAANETKEFDSAILLTKLNLCLNENDCHKAGGPTSFGGMCKKGKSCAVIDDRGLFIGFTIAHVLGHLLNMEHDDEEPCKSFLREGEGHLRSNIPESFVMNSSPWGSPWNWSDCSKNTLTKFLEEGQGACLEKTIPEWESSQGQHENDDLLPGQVYDASQQCRLALTQDINLGSSTPCQNIITDCSHALCTVEPEMEAPGKETEESCKTMLWAWADGTPCQDSSRWCIRGDCVKKGAKN